MSQKSEQKIKSRESILASAANLLRERGIKASSVADVMAGAGLTVGGFYSHFASKEALFTETIKTAANALWDQLLQEAQGPSARERLSSVLRVYLSRRHRDNPIEGCILPSVAPEIAREGEPYRGALEAKLSGFVSSLAGLLGGGKESRERAIAVFALMYGALSLSRALQGTTLSDEFLQAAKKFGATAAPDDTCPPDR
jgi:TetR/AcrR family transcriptional repressor of nem operon